MASPRERPLPAACAVAERHAMQHRLAPTGFAVLVAATGAVGQSTTRVSVDSSGGQADQGSYFPSLSSDGRWVAYSSDAHDLVPGDTNGARDVFLYDSQSGTTERVSIASNGAEGNSYSDDPSISADGRFVAFSSNASNLASGDANGQRDVFVRDQLTGITELVSCAVAGGAGNGDSAAPSLSADGRYVAFQSSATDLIIGDTNGVPDVFMYDRQTGVMVRISLGLAGAQANAACGAPAISADGTHVVFNSTADNLVSGDTNGYSDAFVYECATGVTARVSIATNGAQGNGDVGDCSISANGQLVCFNCAAWTLVPGDVNGVSDTFVHDAQSGVMELASITSSGAQGDAHSDGRPRLSADGRYVYFCTYAQNIGGGGGSRRAVVRDRAAHTTIRVSVDSSGLLANADSGFGGAISADGRYVAFDSTATNLVPGDFNGVSDVFLHDCGQAQQYLITPVCFGDGTGGSCPCANVGAVGHGCDNSWSTGGALLAGSGVALLSADSLVLTSSSEGQVAPSLFWQGGTETVPHNFGDGLGCMGSPLKRMYIHVALGGAVTAPQGADPAISARSAVLGDPIVAGTVRIYHVFYRDPSSTFCPWPLGGQFNVSNGVRVLWGP